MPHSPPEYERRFIVVAPDSFDRNDSLRMYVIVLDKDNVIGNLINENSFTYRHLDILLDLVTFGLKMVVY
jgi:hypothetical protein